MMKETFTGWGGKAGSWWFWQDSDYRVLLISRTRGRKGDWDEADWPPVRVRVTLETVKEGSTK